MSEEREIEELQCKLCWNLLTEPRDLICGHSFCTLCLQDFSKKCASSRIECPCCAEITVLDLWGVLSLKKNEQRSLLVSLMKQKNPNFTFSEYDNTGQNAAGYDAYPQHHQTSEYSAGGYDYSQGNGYDNQAYGQNAGFGEHHQMDGHGNGEYEQQHSGAYDQQNSNGYESQMGGYDYSQSNGYDQQASSSSSDYTQQQSYGHQSYGHQSDEPGQQQSYEYPQQSGNEYGQPHALSDHSSNGQEEELSHANLHPEQPQETPQSGDYAYGEKYAPTRIGQPTPMSNSTESELKEWNLISLGAKGVQMVEKMTGEEKKEPSPEKNEGEVTWWQSLMGKREEEKPVNDAELAGTLQQEEDEARKNLLRLEEDARLAAELQKQEEEEARRRAEERLQAPAASAYAPPYDPPASNPFAQPPPPPNPYSNVPNLPPNPFGSASSSSSPAPASSSSSSSSSASSSSSSDSSEASAASIMSWAGSIAQSFVDKLASFGSLPPGEPVFAPFQIEKDRAIRLVYNWLSSRWFLPLGFSDSVSVHSPFPKFVPFWSITLEVLVKVEGSVMRNFNSVSGAQETFTGAIEKTYTTSYDNELIYASDCFRGYEEISSQIDDWKPSNARTLLKDMPATAQATLDGPRAWESVWRDFMHRVYSEQLTKGQKLLAQDGRITKCEPHLEFKKVEKRLIYLPVFLTSYRHSGKSFPVIVNGVSGRVYANRPFGVGSFLPSLIGMS